MAAIFKPITAYHCIKKKAFVYLFSIAGDFQKKCLGLSSSAANADLMDNDKKHSFFLRWPKAATAFQLKVKLGFFRLISLRKVVSEERDGAERKIQESL